jgi:3-deoxy-D-manno-octulosonic acid kinase
MRKETPRANRSAVLFNRKLMAALPEFLFDPAHADFPGTGEALTGRGSALGLRYSGMHLVLKRYTRGGYPGKFIRDTYLYYGLRRTRMWREFELLGRLRELDLPVPRPVAARCEFTSPLTCRGQIITERIAAARPLADLLAETPLSAATWAGIGAVVSRFHQNGVFHADLNARNILLDHGGKAYLIDFDRGSLRTRRRHRWTRANLNRLLRSLRKCKRLNPRLHFAEADWPAFMEGYDASRPGAGPAGLNRLPTVS